MKRTFLLIVIFVLGCQLTRAQEDKKQYFNIRGGWQMSTLAMKDESPDTTKLFNSFYAGFSNETKIAPMLFWGKGIEYFQSGVKYTENTQRIFHTISVPVNLKLKIGPVFARGGVAANFKVAERYKIADNTITPDDKASWFDLPVYAGAGINILMFSVEARYHWGLIKATDNYYNRYLQVGASLRF